MKPLGPLLFLFLLVLAAGTMLACGSSSATHSLQSVAISPATADAQGYPNGQVPFTATGMYNTKPSPVTPISVEWGACDLKGNATTAVSVSSAGVAQCAGAAGTYTVWGFGSNPSGGTCTAINACGGGCGRITGTAQLTCP